MVVAAPKPTSNASQRRYLRAAVRVHFPIEEKVPESQEHLWVRTALWLMLARDRPWKRKFEAYQRTGVLELVRFDPARAKKPLRFWDRVDGDLVEREVSGHSLERSDVLGLHWLLDRSPEFGLMLRFSRDAIGQELLLTGEEALSIEAEARRIEAEGRRIEAEGRRAAEARVRQLEAELARRSKD